MFALLPGAQPIDPGLNDVDFLRMSFSGSEEDPLFLNDGHGKFTDTGFQARVDLRGDGRSGVWADLDGDGDLDLIVRQMQAPKMVVLRNDLPPGAHWMAVSLVGTKSNRMGVGAVVRACVAGACQTRLIRAGHGFLAQGPPLAHFGLGTSAVVDELTVEWPSGATSRAEHVAADADVVFTEDQPAPVRTERKKVALGPPVPPVVSMQSLLAANPKGPEGAALASAAAAHKPTVINLWAPWCKPCKAEAPVLAAYAKACGDSVSFVGLSMEPDLAASQKGAAEIGLALPISLSSPEQALMIDRASEGTPLPTTLLFDESGALQRAIVGKVTPEALQKLHACPATDGGP